MGRVQIFGSDKTPTNQFTKTTKKNTGFQKTPRTKSRSPTPSRQKNYTSLCSSICSIVLLLPIILIISILALFYFSVISNKNDKLFCSDNKQIPECIHCPIKSNGKCIDGKAKCNSGYTLVDAYCIANDQIEKIENIKLYSKMKKFIASSINLECNRSIYIEKQNLEIMFGKSKSFQAAIKLLEENDLDPEYEIMNVNSNGFIAQKPILNTRCKIKFFYHENRLTLFLFAVALALTVILFFVVVHNLKISKQIKICSREVVRNIKRSQRGEFKKASDYTFVNSNPMSKCWDSIEREVERNPAVTVLNGINGKLWGYV